MAVPGDECSRRHGARPDAPLGSRAAQRDREENDIWQLWTFRGGKVIYYEDFATREQAAEAAGLSE